MFEKINFLDGFWLRGFAFCYAVTKFKTKYGELHLPGKNYCGPLTRLDIRLDEHDVPKHGEEPTNKVDEACLKHDIAYRNENIRDRQKADIDLIQDLNEIGKPTFREKLDRAIVKTAMKAKIVFGGENKIENEDELLAQDLHKEYRNVGPSRAESNKKYLKIKVFNKDDIWSADLIETVNVKNNDNFRHILTVIDLYTRYAWAIPFKNQTSNSIKEAFERLFKKTPDRIPKESYTLVEQEICTVEILRYSERTYRIKYIFNYFLKFVDWFQRYLNFYKFL